MEMVIQMNATTKELHYKITKGFSHDFFQKLYSKSKDEADDTIQCVRFWLMLPNSRKGPTKEEVSQFFALIMQKFVNGHTLRLFFPHHTNEVKKKIIHLDIQGQGTKRWLWFEIIPTNFPILVDILKAVSFTHFYAKIDGDSNISTTTENIFNRIKQSYVFFAFDLFDDSIEIFSASISDTEIINIARDVCLRLNIPIKQC